MREQAAEQRSAANGRPPHPAIRPPPCSPCLDQDGKPVPAPNRLRAIGTEPFWGARIEGRCVTYSHPEDQTGDAGVDRIRAGPRRAAAGRGSLGGKPFVLRTRPQPGCSDGMSDNRYPIAVTLTVGGEQRTGCAEPLWRRRAGGRVDRLETGTVGSRADGLAAVRRF